MTGKQKHTKKAFVPDELNDLFGLTVVKTVRIPTELFEDVEKAARQQGSNFNDTVINSLRAYLGFPSDEGAVFIQKIYKWVISRWPIDDFPENVTQLVFRHIQETPALFKNYQTATRDREQREIINRKIGKMVKQALNATVIGRSLPITGTNELITSYALLRPTKSMSEI